MNILVLGGLFLVGLAAIVVAALLAMSDHGSENSAAAPALAMAASAPAPAPSSVPKTGGPAKRLTVPLHAPESAPGNTRTAVPVGQSLSAIPIESLPLANEEAPYSPLFDGQLHELAAELRSLHARTREVEHRLSVLLEMVDRLEHDQGTGLDFDETTISPDIPPGR